jgi:hypothetical protein
MKCQVKVLRDSQKTRLAIMFLFPNLAKSKSCYIYNVSSPKSIKNFSSEG